MLRIFVSVCLFAVLASTSIPARAQTSDSRTYFTFSQPVTLPAITLPAGKYVFRIMDTTASRRVVQVQDARGRNYGLMWSIPIRADHIPGDAQVRFIEGLEGTVAAVRAWWYPGTSIGSEFIYPREQAMRLAERGRTSVLTTSTTASATDIQDADLLRVSPTGEGSRVNEPAKAVPMMLDVPPAVLPPPLSESALPLASWLGALSMVAGAFSQQGPHLGL